MAAIERHCNENSCSLSRGDVFADRLFSEYPVMLGYEVEEEGEGE